MKYLLIGALLVLLLLLLYSRVHPYLKALQKILATVRGLTASQSETAGAGTRKASVESKLVRCVGCGTWVPADRAIGAGHGASTYCSRECLERPQNQKETKLAG